MGRIETSNLHSVSDRERRDNEISRRAFLVVSALAGGGGVAVATKPIWCPFVDEVAEETKEKLKGAFVKEGTEPPPPKPWKPDAEYIRGLESVVDEHGFFRVSCYPPQAEQALNQVKSSLIMGDETDTEWGIVFDAINHNEDVDCLMVPLGPGGEPVDGVGYFVSDEKDIYEVLDKLRANVPEALESPRNCLGMELTTWEVMLANGKETPNLSEDDFVFIPLSWETRKLILEKIYSSPIVEEIKPDTPPTPTETAVIASPISPITPVTPEAVEGTPTAIPPTPTTQNAIERVTPTPISLKCGDVHMVVSGDTLIGIGRKSETSWQRIAAANGIPWPFKIQPKDRLRIPCDGEEYDMKILTPVPTATVQPTSTVRPTSTMAPTFTSQPAPTSTSVSREVQPAATPTLIASTVTPRIENPAATPTSHVPEVETKEPPDLTKDVIWEEHEVAAWVEAFSKAAKDGNLPDDFNLQALFLDQPAHISAEASDFVRQIEVLGRGIMDIEFRGLGVNEIPPGSQISHVARREASEHGIEVGYTTTLFGYPAMILKKGKLNYLVIYPQGDTPDEISGQSFSLCWGCESAVSNFVNPDAITYESWVAACKLDCGKQTDNQTFQAIIMAFWDRSEDGVNKVEYIR